MSSDPDPSLVLAQGRVGRTLREKWRLDRLLGVGGMASVYAATHRNGKRGAVKLLHPEISANPRWRARFLREGYVANKVDHPGVVSVVDDDVAEDGAVFLVMELLEGETVDAWAARSPGGRLDAAEVAEVADQLLDVLVVAHDRGVIHRDLKPENLFLSGGRLKVLDFGIARLREGSAGVTGHTTRGGGIMGTPAFMPPEQALGNSDHIDRRSDLWAVGATMFRLLTGRDVHEADTVQKLMLAAMTRPAPPIATVLDSVPGALAAVIDRALAFDRDARWPDAGAMQKAVRDTHLSEVALPLGSPASLGPLPPIGSDRAIVAAKAAPAVTAHSTGARRRRVMVVALSAAALAALALAAGVLGGSGTAGGSVGVDEPAASATAPAEVPSSTRVVPGGPASEAAAPAPPVEASAAPSASVAPHPVAPARPVRPARSASPKSTSAIPDFGGRTR